jgi:benzodiazapine receptor
MYFMDSQNKRSWIALGGFCAAVTAAAWFGSRYSPRDARTRLWYNRLKKPSFTPPKGVYPVVWTGLYALMAVSGWRVWQAESSEERSHALRLWVAQLASNAEWTRIFFGEHRPLRALLDIGVLETAIVKYIAAASKVDRTAAVCFVPYAGWVAFAAVLNAEIVRLNPGARKLFPRARVA